MIELSVVIITLNEEARLGRCLESLPEGVEVVVLDSGSTDKTVEVASKHGARTATRPFDDYASQKNAAIALASRRWILSLDADEVLSQIFVQKVVQFVSSPEGNSTQDAFKVLRRLNFMGKVMFFGKTSDRPTRLFLRGSGKFYAKVHEQFKLDSGQVRRAPFGRGAHILHYSYENLTDYFDKFNRYTSRIAELRANNEATQPRRGCLAFAGHVSRPFFEFFSRYVLRLGFLDGYPGYCYALISSLYAFVKYAKLIERSEKS